MKAYSVHQTSWQGIPLSVSYWPDWSEAFSTVMGRPLAHLTIEGTRPLPITETGFLSHFTGPDLVESEGGPVGFVQAWLDLAAELPEWRTAQDSAAQLSLF